MNNRMTNPKAVFKGKNYRISIISDMIIRLEYDEEGIFNDYTSMTPLILNTLKGMGFTHSEDGKHHRFLFAGDDRYSGTTSKTSSDCRAGKNFASDISNKIF